MPTNPSASPALRTPTLLLRAVDILTGDDEGTVLRDAALAIEGERILAVVPAGNDLPPGFAADEILDLPDRLVMPGFYNGHTHAAMTLLRGYAEDLPLARWFNERVWVAESRLTEEDVHWGTALALCEMIRGGTVGFADHYFYMDRVAGLAAESGLRALLAWCVFGGVADVGGIDLARTRDFVQRWHGAAGGRIRTCLGPHSLYVPSALFLRQVAEAAAQLGTGVHIHLTESPEQVQNSLLRHGQTPVGYAAALGLLDVPALAAHCLYLDDEDIAVLAQRRVSVVVCPNCHMKLGLGTVRVPELLAAGVNVALGSDGPASGNNLDMLEEARLCSLMQKLARRDPTVLPNAQALRLATRNGALALGFPDSGVLAAGRAADLIAIDQRAPHLCPRHDLTANVLHAANAGDVSDVMVAGRWLMRDRRLLTLDEERIRHEAARCAARMTGGEADLMRSYQG